MDGKQEKKYINGEVVNAISKILMVKTDSDVHPAIDLIRNSLTTQSNPLLKEIGLYAQLKMEQVDGPYGKMFLIIEVTKASARAAYERTYADLIASGRVGVPNDLSAEIPPTITLEQYHAQKLAALDLSAADIPAVLRVMPRTSDVVPALEPGNQNGASNVIASTSGTSTNGYTNGAHANIAHANGGRSNGTSDELTLWRLTPEGAAITAGD